MRASNAIYDVPEGRPIWKTAPIRLGVTVVTMILLVAAAFMVVVTGSSCPCLSVPGLASDATAVTLAGSHRDRRALARAGQRWRHWPLARGPCPAGEGQEIWADNALVASCLAADACDVRAPAQFGAEFNGELEPGRAVAAEHLINREPLSELRDHRMLRKEEKGSRR